MSSSCDTFDKCHLDSLKLVKKPLPLPPPQDKMWMATQHVIDDLHIKNHKRKSCHDHFNPQKVKDVVPDANLMCAEQTFTWQSRYKKVLNSMTKTRGPKSLIFPDGNFQRAKTFQNKTKKARKWFS